MPLQHHLGHKLVDRLPLPRAEARRDAAKQRISQQSLSVMPCDCHLCVIYGKSCHLCDFDDVFLSSMDDKVMTICHLWRFWRFHRGRQAHPVADFARGSAVAAPFQKDQIANEHPPVPRPIAAILAADRQLQYNAAKSVPNMYINIDPKLRLPTRPGR